MLPNLSQTVKRFSVPTQLMKVSTAIVNHKPYYTGIESNIKVVIQPAQKEKLNIDRINWSLKYIQVHSVDCIYLSDIITHKGILYQAYEDADYSDYGYYEIIMEEYKSNDITVVYNLDNSTFEILNCPDTDFMEVITNNVIQSINNGDIEGLVDMNIDTWTIIK